METNTQQERAKRLEQQAREYLMQSNDPIFTRYLQQLLPRIQRQPEYVEQLQAELDKSVEFWYQRQQMQVTADTLKELGAGDIPQIIVYNKADKCEMEPLPQKRQGNWYLAAGLNIGIRELAEAVEQKVYADNAECVFLIPYSAGNVASYLMEQAQILSREYREDGILIHADCHRQDMDRYREYIVS